MKASAFLQGASLADLKAMSSSSTCSTRASMSGRYDLPLVALCSAGEPEVVEEACWALSNVALGGLSEQIATSRVASVRGRGCVRAAHEGLAVGASEEEAIYYVPGALPHHQADRCPLTLT